MPRCWPATTTRSPGGGWRPRPASASRSSTSARRHRRRWIWPRSTACRPSLRYARSQADADARHAIATPLGGVRPDDARTLLTAAGERADLLEVIAKGAVAGATRFAHGLATVTAAYQHARRLGGERAGRAVRELSARARADARRAGADRARLRRRARVRAAVGSRRPAGRARRRAGRRAAPFAAARRRRCAGRQRAGWHRVRWNRARRAGRRRGRGAGAAAQALVQRLVAQRVRRVRAQMVLPLRLRGGRGPRLVGLVLRHRVSRRAGGLPHRARALRRRPAPTRRRWRPRSTTTWSPRSTATARRFDAPVEFELQKRRARRTAKKYLGWLLERARRAPFEVVGNETAIDLSWAATASSATSTGSTATRAPARSPWSTTRPARSRTAPRTTWPRCAPSASSSCRSTTGPAPQAGDVVTRLALVPLKDALLDVAPVELEVVTTSRPPRSKGATRRDRASPSWSARATG